MGPAHDGGERGRTLGAQGWGQGSERRPSLPHSTSTRLFYSPQKGSKSLIVGSWPTAPPGGGPPSPWHLLVSGRQALCLSVPPGIWHRLCLAGDRDSRCALCPHLMSSTCGSAVIQPVSQMERLRPREAE